MICEMSLWEPFLRRYIQTRKVHSKNGTSQIGTYIIPRRLELQTQLFCGLLTLSCDKMVPYLQRGEVLMRYETLYFQLRKKKHAISVTPPLLIPVTQDCFTVKIIS